MRQPISVQPTRSEFCVAFVHRDATWETTVIARDRSDAITEATLLLAHARHHELADRLGRMSSEHEWHVTTVRPVR